MCRVCQVESQQEAEKRKSGSWVVTLATGLTRSSTDWGLNPTFSLKVKPH